jgi:XTP/dITP diphosphohydrolase
MSETEHGLSANYPPRLLVATTNARKGREMLQILSASGLDIELVTLAAYPDAPEVQETGDTFVDNSRLKAIAGVELSGLVTIADDGGLCIDALDGLPGVKSHRFLGAETGFPEKMAYILDRLKDTPEADRSCRFHSAVVIATPDGRQFTCEGTCEGRIGYEMTGSYGFGYDPIFYLPEMGRYMAELTPEDKHAISHRGKALACAVERLKELFGANA